MQSPTDLIWNAESELDQPLLVLAFKGLFDVAEAATTAVSHLAGQSETTRIAEIDPESFFDFSQQRPVVSLNADGRREITWPTNEVLAAPRTGERDLLLLSGIEPHLRWRSFAACIAEIAERTKAELVITLGAMVGMAPHTRPLGVVGSATDPLLATRLGLGRPSYEGPTGLVGALHAELDAANLPVISLRVSVPHYVPAPPNPEATRSLLKRFELVTGVTSDHQRFDEDAASWRHRVDAAVADDDEMGAYVGELERQVDASADELLPSGDDLAAELQAFLRDRRGDAGTAEDVATEE